MPSLDDDYANGPYIPGAEDYPPRWAKAALSFRTEMGANAELSQQYGPSARQCFDLFKPDGTPKGTLIFVHGGYWRAFDNQSWSHLAAGPLAKGWNVAMPSYDLCPNVTIAMITQQIAAAVTHIADRSNGSIALAGHSAGGHLVARMLADGILHTRIRQRMTHVMPISPLSDLGPLVQTAMNDDFRMDAAMARAESPLDQAQPKVPVTVWVGAAERPAFIDQARWLASHWNCPIVEEKDKHHFDVIDSLTNPHSDMVSRLTF